MFQFAPIHVFVRDVYREFKVRGCMYIYICICILVYLGPLVKFQEGVQLEFPIVLARIYANLPERERERERERDRARKRARKKETSGEKKESERGNERERE